MEDQRLHFVWCVVGLGLVSVHLDALSIQPINKMGADSREIRGNLHNLLDSINDNNPKKTEMYRSLLQKEAAQDKQVFDAAKEEWRYTQKRKNSVPIEVHQYAKFKREAEAQAGTCPSKNPSNVTIEFITANTIAEKGVLNETFHDVCKRPDDERVQFCKKVLEQDFAKRNNIKYVEGGALGPEKKYEFILNGSPRSALLLKNSVHMTACTCPTEPVVLYLRNDFGKAEAVQAYALLPFSAHGEAA